MLILAFLTRYLVFEVTSVAALLMGSALVFTNMESYVKARVANLSMRGPLMALHQSLINSGFAGRAFYIPDRNQGDPVKMLIATSNADPQAAVLNEQSVQGTLLDAPGEGVVEILREELGGLSGKNFIYLEEWLPRAVVEGLGLAEKMWLKLEGDEVKMEIQRPVFQTLCQDPELNETVCVRFGCPFAGGIAAALAESTGRGVEFVTCGHDRKLETSTGLFMLRAQVSQRNFEHES